MAVVLEPRISTRRLAGYEDVFGRVYSCANLSVPRGDSTDTVDGISGYMNHRHLGGIQGVELTIGCVD